ncbi:2OG-Fe(II) oxygenase [Alteromonas sp. a30]|uniref:2OG-Fe(II) oxygenase n=1 Tax=Alteromonas sp. a30 TaxID=2730917 RepID=UPI00227DA4A4|nr:2OG-Fe(II) oxygenase [Alteromonas sp. a30]MCY7296705.1 2OG-Fe(II) oxygenase [Alteromonas sp. a30]
MVSKPLLNFEQIVANPQILQLAEMQLLKSLEARPKAPEILWQLAETYRKQGRLDKAAVLYQRLSGLLDIGEQRQLAQDLYAIMSGKLANFVGQDKCYPVPFVLKHDYLTQADLSTLRHYIHTEAWDNHRRSEVGKGEYDEQIRQSFDLPLPQWLKQKMLIDVSISLPELSRALQIPQVDFGRIDLFLRGYGNGQFFSIHTDKLPNVNRHLSMTYFFYFEPQQFTGGDLLIFDTHLSQNEKREFSESFTRLNAVQNTLAVFPSASYHAVSTVNTCIEDRAAYRYAINAHVWEKDNKEENTHGKEQ